jgi:exodeoxyribonuclease V alpha subunit
MTEPRIAMAATGALREFNVAGVLAPADVHVARRLGELAGERDERVLLAAALAVRGPRLGSVFVDLETIHETATADVDEPVDVAALPWPDPAGWAAAVAASPLQGADRPLRLEGSALYLDRYWREEVRLAADLRALRDAPPVDSPRPALDRLTDARQRMAAETALRRRFTVVAGGPGTGKTRTVAEIVALLREQDPRLLIALAAPTAVAAARMTEAVKAAGHDLEGRTLHRLLGWRPRTRSRFRHDRGNRLPHDVVIVDETSMVGLWQMARLVEAVRPGARLILVGDPNQLAPIEAGVVLGDIAAAGGDAVVELQAVYRYDERIGRVAEAIRAGDADAVIAALQGVTWLDDPDGALDPVRERAEATARDVTAAACAGDGPGAIRALGSFRLLCAHRRGPYGVAAWTARIEDWIGRGGAEWYAGRPLLVTRNDYSLRLFNGDTGVVVEREPGVLLAAFERAEVSPTRLAAVETVYAMTVHKAQGSQFRTAAVVLPEAGSQLLTRELLYTAVTRAQEELILVGAEETIRAAVTRRAVRASGLRARLTR